MRTTTIVGMPYPLLKPTCACRRCRTRRAKHTPRVVESTLVTIGQSTTAGWKKRLLWGLSSAGLLLLALLLLAGVGMLWDSGPLAPLLFRPTALVTIVPTRLDSQTMLVITAVTGTPNAARHEVAARFVSATTPGREAFGQASGVAHVPATVAFGTLTFYNAATYPQTIADRHGTHGSRRCAGGHRCCGIYPAGNPPLFGVVTVSAHTLQAGSRGNIAALDIDGLCCVAGVAVKNTADFSGEQEPRPIPRSGKRISMVLRVPHRHADTGRTGRGTITVPHSGVDGDHPRVFQRSQHRSPRWKPSDTGDSGCRRGDMPHRGVSTSRLRCSSLQPLSSRKPVLSSGRTTHWWVG